ncbi:ABC transporter ATP-binding protein [Viridibacillus sp. YIM B01967]|uniref:ABC transporter ATP-binding protein n=1 Tax=Viridibacillus soli TaxID=2798301 RepID=A0ABS1H3E9_9BACL|nr:ABC transporter ATP-binding protein [Viridibacillus soli]MBK3493945.1 ABC transporter ATP-binding protein [Viridibacillus soli]
MGTILKCTNLAKSYGTTEAVKNIDMTLEENTIYGLIGRNGAGKTSLLNIITGSIFQDYGEVEIAGKKINRSEDIEDLCYVKEKILLFNHVKVMELLEIASAFHKNWDWDFAKDLLKMFELNPEKKFRQLSRGMESHVGIIIGLASRAPLTIFDEPVLGLDVIMREKFYSIMLEDYSNYPRTILMSTHLVNEITKIVEKIYIIDSGKILLHEDMDSFRNKSYYVTGNRKGVENFIEGKNVIQCETQGNIMIAALFDTINDKEMHNARRLDLSIDGMPLQKFFTYFVDGRNHIE